MRLLLETICVREGVCQHLAYHQARMEHALQRSLAFDWQEKLQAIVHTYKGLVKCRILYRETIEDITFHSYSPNPPKTLQLIEAPNLAYPLKYADRTEIEALKARADKADDILITQHGYITDTSYANIALFDGKDWVTPEKPLLEGTTRARAIHAGKLKTASIHLKDLPAYTKLRLFNAMLPFEEAYEAVILAE